MCGQAGRSTCAPTVAVQGTPTPPFWPHPAGARRWILFFRAAADAVAANGRRIESHSVGSEVR